jgi:ABC-type transport system involved in cytochrome c biogenesis permease subunit
MNPALINQELATTSRILVLIALTVYVISFLVLTVSLANRAKATKKEQTASAIRVENFGLILAGLATLIHGAGVLTRGIAANRVPWANMYEFSISGAFVVSAIYLIALFFKDIRFIATFVIGFVVLVIGSANTLFYVQVELAGNPR